MRMKRTEDFRAGTVRITQTSGLTRKQVASDLGVDLSTLSEWMLAHRDTQIVFDNDVDLDPSR